MIVLAVETVTRAGSLALFRDGRVVASATGASTRTHAERLPGEAIDFLGANALTLADVTLFAVVSGPGSFTGIRVGMAAVQGLAYAGRKRVVGISTLDAGVEAWIIGRSRKFQSDGLVVPCIDAARGEVYFAAYEVPDAAATVEECRPVMGPSVATPASAVALVAKLAVGRSVVFVGDGAVRYAGELGGLEARGTRLGEGAPKSSTPQAPEPSRVQLIGWPAPLAEGAARIAARRHAEAAPPHALQPLYVRRPDVELARDRGIGQSGGLPAVAPEVRRPGPTGPQEPIGPAGPAMSISRAEPADIEAVERLQRATFSNPWGADAIRWELDNTDVARLYVMRDAVGALAGYCACWVVFDELHINSLAIDPARRRRGLARHLLRQVLAEARAEGATSSTLEVRASNIAARQLYEGLGFTVEAARRDYYQQPREDALILWKRGL